MDLDDGLVEVIHCLLTSYQWTLGLCLYTMQRDPPPPYQDLEVGSVNHITVNGRLHCTNSQVAIRG